MTNKTEEQYQLIKRFFDYDLTESELVEFRTKYETDNDFRKLIQDYEIADEIAKKLYGSDKEIQNFKHLKTFPQSTKEKTSSNKRKINFKFLLVAASFLVLILGAYFLLKPNYINNKEAAFLSQNIAELSLTLDNTVRSSEQHLSQLHQAYTNKEWEEILSILASTEKVSQQSDLLLYKGIAFSKLERWDEAIAVFKSIILLNSNHTDVAHWWLASIYFDQSDLKNAKHILHQIIKEDYPSKNKANTLLKKIK